MRADLSLYRIELLLEHRDFLDSFKVQVQFVLPEPLDLVVPHQQHYQLHQKFIYFNVLLHSLQLLCSLLLVALDATAEACEDSLLARV